MAVHSAAPAAEAAAFGPPLPSLHLAPCHIAGVAQEARCGVFRVAEDARQSRGRVLALKVVILQARAKHPLEPIFDLPGGPGGNATEDASGMGNWWLTDEHPVVMMNPRGSDPETGLGCPSAGENLDQEMAPLFSEGDAYWRACRDALAKRADLTRYTTPLYIADLEALRRALGYNKIDLYGGSYGTRTAISYIHAHGEHVRAALLTGLAPIAERGPLFFARDAEAAFDRTVADCAADSACHAAFPSVHQDLDTILDRLRLAPAQVIVNHPVTGAPVAVHLTAPAFADSIRVMLYSTRASRRLPLLLHRAAAGDLVPFAQAAVQSGYGFRSGLKLGLTLSATCSEDVPRIRPYEIGPATAGSFIGDTRVRGQIAACALWPRTTLPQSYFAAFRSPVPVLLVSGERDPVTPPIWGEAARKSFPNSVHIIVPWGHASVDDCVAGLAAQVFRMASVMNLDMRCLASNQLPPFELK
jgi:pimeloyl-ACP methyl ester carboxylesterase